MNTSATPATEDQGGQQPPCRQKRPAPTETETEWEKSSSKRSASLPLGLDEEAILPLPPPPAEVDDFWSWVNWELLFVDVPGSADPAAEPDELTEAADWHVCATESDESSDEEKEFPASDPFDSLGDDLAGLSDPPLVVDPFQFDDDFDPNDLRAIL